MHLYFWWLIVISIIQNLPVNANYLLLDYCRINRRNTPCMFDCQRSSKCGNTNTSYYDTSPAMRQFIIEMHNQLKEYVFSDAYAVHLKQPKYNFVNAFSYDKECEFFAACYAKQCQYHPDRIRIALDGTELGQNRFVVSGLRGSFDKYSREQLVERIVISALHSWIRTGKKVSGGWHSFLHKSYKPQIRPVRLAAFTQLVWDKTIYVGCAVMHSAPDSRWEMIVLLCNYRPAGNIIGEPVYLLDNEPCKKQEQMPQMVAPICLDNFRAPGDDHYEPPIDLNHASIIRYHLVYLLLGPVSIMCHVL